MRNLRLRSVVLLSSLALVGTATLVVAPAGAAPGDPPGVGLEVYTGQVDAADVETLRGLGLDAEHFVVDVTADGKVEVEVAITDQVATKLQKAGVEIDVKRVHGKKASDVLAEQAQQGWDAFRQYGAPGGIRDEILAAAAEHSDIAKVVDVGDSVNGQEILAVKVTKNANQLKDGKRPSVLYLGTQHAREWISPEMIRRLMHDVLDGYGSDPAITSLVDTTELWFLPVANPDGYDFTFTEGNRLWRKNLRDNNGDGQITVGDGVDPNRNFATNWGYDNEGSSADPASDTYRGPAAGSEPETKVLDALFQRVGFEFFVNYHSAAELLLYGIGHQVSTPSPDDVIYQAMVGTDDNPAVPGYDPDLSAELYITNGDTDTHAQVQYGTLGFTPEMSTCTTIANSVPDDEWLAADCASDFIFPDDEELIQAEYAKNVPFALAVARSTHDPDDPVSVTGIDTPDMVIDAFDTSYGTTQPVAITAKRELLDLRLNYSVNGGAAKSVTTAEWAGGERYGADHDDYYAEFRGVVEGTASGDSVEVWFSGVKPKTGPVSSEHFTYSVHDDIGGDVLVLAAEDVTGLSPAQGLTEAQFDDEYAASLEAAGYTTDVYDFDLMGRQAPHHLGVLSHYDAVVWETGNDVILRSPGQVPGTTAKAAHDIEISVRDYVNEGGKLAVAGKYALFGQAGGYSYNPEAPPECTDPDNPTCFPLSNDFMQYWLGTYTNVSDGGTGPDGNPYPLEGKAGAFDGFTGTLNAAGSAGNQDHTASFLTTSSFLPEGEFPQFGSSAPLKWLRPGGAPFDPRTGGWYVFSQTADRAYKRLTATVDLTTASSGQLSFWTSFDTEPDWDYVFVEAHPVGSDDWTTLPDVSENPVTQTGTGESCAAGWVDELHPFLAHYQGADCSPTGMTGNWNAATGSSNGWHQWMSDLTPYVGGQVEVSITYATDWGTQGLGVFIDDTEISVNGALLASTSFESDLGGWATPDAPDGSAPNTNTWARSQTAFEEGSGVVTEDTVFVGFGLEGLAPAERNDLVDRSMRHLLSAP